MLDLTVLVEKFFEIKMPNGEIISIKKPTQALAISLSNNSDLEEAKSKGEIEKVLEIVIDKVILILNNNKEGRVFKIEDIKDFDLNIIKIIVEEYLKWVEGLNNNPK